MSLAPTIAPTTTAASAAATPAVAPAAPALPEADLVVAHTLLNCLLREVSGPEHQTAVTDGRLLLRLPRRGALLRVTLRRTSLLGAHRFTGPVELERADGWAALDWRELAELVQAELTLRTGVANEEFTAQLRSSQEGVLAALSDRRTLADRPSSPEERYLESEQALLFGHRFHPAPKSRSARGADRSTWSAYAPEARAAFPLRYLAVREHLIAERSIDPAATALLDGLREVPYGYRLLPTHPWQYELLGEHPALRAALDRGDILDLGTGGPDFAATASVRTLHGAGAFLKFSLNVRITNCLRKNAAYELTGAVELTELLDPALTDLAERFPYAAMLREPAFRTLALPGPDGAPDTELFEGFGLIVREDLGARLRPGLTALLAAAVADEYPTSSAQLGQLLDGAAESELLDWWTRYLRLLLPPVLAAYFDHGVVLEPHLQNVLIGVDAAGRPAQVLFRDLEGTKLVPELLSRRDAAVLAGLPAQVAGPMSYDAQRGWDRVVYCLLVNHVAELLAAVADQNPSLEPELWDQVWQVLEEYADGHGCPPRLRALLAGVPLPAKANLLTRWERKADRAAGYVRLPSPLAPDVLTQAARATARSRSAR
ncbi:IucA/IucC family protein [Kitasatospora azatica]|uniref:IucA/IucC family protein n=1 Tax=Kitasatospora azatica TaxID=58347 RepID=UPI0009FD1A09|nr:IucA/IucC family protein [Kitasatospora azatica]